MGGIVKGIGKAVKGVMKIVKKALPIIVIAAAIYFGVAAYGAALLKGGAAAGAVAGGGAAAGGAASAGSWTAFKAGLSGIGAKFGMSTAMSGQVTPFKWVTAVKGGIGSGTGGQGIMTNLANASSSAGPAWEAAGRGATGMMAGGEAAGAAGTAAKGGFLSKAMGRFNNMSPLAQSTLIQGISTLGSSALAAMAPEEESTFEQQRKAMEIGINGKVLDYKGNVRDAVNLTDPNQGLQRVASTYGSQPQQGLIMSKPAIPVTHGPTPSDVTRGIIRRSV